MTNYLSPIAINGPYVLESSLWVNEVGPSGDMRCNVNVEMSTEDVVDGEDEYILPAKLTADIELYDDTEERGERMRANMVVAGRVSITKRVKAEHQEIVDNLRLNAASMFYSFVKYQIENQTSMTPMQRFTIPSINPQELLKAINELPGKTD